MVNPKREAILQHVARYGLSLRPVLDRLFFEGVEDGCERDLAELRKAGLLDVVENAVGDRVKAKTRYSYYFPTRKATALLGVPDNHGKPPGPDAVPRNLAILWYCAMRPNRSYRLRSNEVIELLSSPDKELAAGSGEQLPKGYHCLSSVDDRFRLLNIYPAKTTVKELMSELRKRVTKAKRNPAITLAMKSRQFGFLVLVETKKLQDQVWEETRKLAREQKAKFIVTESPGPWK